MKTAEEWEKEIDHSRTFYQELGDDRIVKLIKQIQLDAYKAGILEARSVVGFGGTAQQTHDQITKLAHNATLPK